MSIDQQVENIALHKAYKAINDQIIPRLEKLEDESITAEKLERLMIAALKNSHIKERLNALEVNLKNTGVDFEPLMRRIERLEHDLEKERNRANNNFNTLMSAKRAYEKSEKTIDLRLSNINKHVDRVKDEFFPYLNSVVERIQNLEHSLSTLHPSQSLIERIEALEKETRNANKNFAHVRRRINYARLLASGAKRKCEQSENNLRGELDRVSWLYCGLLITSFAATIFVNHFILG